MNNICTKNICKNKISFLLLYEETVIKPITEQLSVSHEYAANGCSWNHTYQITFITDMYQAVHLSFKLISAFHFTMLNSSGTSFIIHIVV